MFSMPNGKSFVHSNDPESEQAPAWKESGSLFRAFVLKPCADAL